MFFQPLNRSWLDLNIEIDNTKLINPRILTHLSFVEPSENPEHGGVGDSDEETDTVTDFDFDRTSMPSTAHPSPYRTSTHISSSSIRAAQPTTSMSASTTTARTTKAADRPIDKTGGGSPTSPGVVLPLLAVVIQRIYFRHAWVVSAILGRQWDYWVGCEAWHHQLYNVQIYYQILQMHHPQAHTHTCMHHTHNTHMDMDTHTHTHEHMHTETSTYMHRHACACMDKHLFAVTPVSTLCILGRLALEKSNFTTNMWCYVLTL